MNALLLGRSWSKDACAHALADHIDEALALAEQLAGTALGKWRHRVTNDAEHSGRVEMSGDDLADRFSEIREFISRLRSLELAVTTRITRARVWAERLRRYDPRLERIAGQFLGGTHAFVDAGAAAADTTNSDFATADPSLAYLRSRGLIDPHVTGLDQIDEITPGYRFELWGGVPLFDVAELLHTFLSAADVHYTLYLPDNESASEAATADSFSVTSAPAAPAAPAALPVWQADPVSPEEEEGLKQSETDPADEEAAHAANPSHEKLPERDGDDPALAETDPAASDAVEEENRVSASDKSDDDIWDDEGDENATTDADAPTVHDEDHELPGNAQAIGDPDGGVLTDDGPDNSALASDDPETDEDADDFAAADDVTATGENEVPPLSAPVPVMGALNASPFGND